MRKHKSSRSSRWNTFLNAFGFGGRGKGVKPQQRRTLTIQPLEERALLSVCHWTGANGCYWNNAGNWQDANHQAILPQAGDDLVFDGATPTATQNDFADGTAFHSVEFANNNFSLASASGSHTITLTGGVTVDTGVTGSAISLGMALDGNVAFNVADTQSLTVSGVLSGDGSLTKTGSGTLSLSGSNSYAGDTTISAGTLKVATGNTIPSNWCVDAGDTIVNGTLDLYASTTLNNLSGSSSGLITSTNTTNRVLYVCNSEATTYAGQITDGSSHLRLDVSGTAMLSLTGTNSYTRGTNVSDGLLSFAAGALGTTGTISIADESTLQWAQGNSEDVSSRFNFESASDVIFDVAGGTVTLANDMTLYRASPTFTKTGSGTLAMTGDLSVLGGITVAGGTLQVGNGGASGSVLSGTGVISLSDDATLAFARSDTYAFAQVISGDGNVVQKGSGTLTLTEANDYTGTTTVSQGTLSVDDFYCLGNATSAIVLGDASHKGTLSYTGDGLALERGLTLNAGGGEFDVANAGTAASLTGSIGVGSLVIGGAGDTTISSVLSGSRSLTKTGSGTLFLTGANTYTGGTTIAGGVLEAVNLDSLPGYTSSDIAIASGAILAVSTANWSNNDIADLAANWSFGSHALGIDVPQSGGVVYSNVIGGDLGIAKLGEGNLTLSAANTYTGGTTVIAGVLLLGDDDCLPTSGAITAAGGVLNLAGYSQATSGAVSLQGGEIANGTLVKSGADYDVQSGTIGANLTGNVGLVKTTSGIAILTGANTYTGDTTVEAGVLETQSQTALPGYPQMDHLSIAPGATMAMAIGESNWSSTQIQDFLANPSTISGTLAIDVSES